MDFDEAMHSMGNVSKVNISVGNLGQQDNMSRLFEAKSQPLGILNLDFYLINQGSLSGGDVSFTPNKMTIKELEEPTLTAGLSESSQFSVSKMSDISNLEGKRELINPVDLRGKTEPIKTYHVNLQHCHCFVNIKVLNADADALLHEEICEKVRELCDSLETVQMKPLYKRLRINISDISEYTVFILLIFFKNCVANGDIRCNYVQ